VEWSRKVAQIFDTVRQVGAGEILPKFLQIAGPDEFLEVIVTGYADPRPFSGPYVENDPVTFYTRDGSQITVHKGDTIGNLELSGLRAWNAGQYLRTLFAETPGVDLPELMRTGRLRFRHVGAGVDTAGSAMEAQRRIHIGIERRSGSMP
jgi:hypothetical protein